MNILALYTTSEYGSLAVWGGGVMRAGRHMHSSEGFAHLILPAIQETIEQSGLALGDIDCFSAASGPGSFTGVRVGLAAIKGLAEAGGKPVAGISNLRAMATFGTAAERAVILDARRSQVFAAIYNSDLELVSPEVVTDLAAWLENLQDFRGQFIASRALRASLPADQFVEAKRHLASAVAFCAERDGRSGRWSDAATLDANYLRRPDAELFWKN
jgi:tRNA threonylcarbamoyladenosine biosynthesis protein TsaB